ncbi:493_t:CDS:2 [Gigaspora margarita]|uniref:493_t:CDS:1 n=1 Tax=Gigaspora margarita TaxID=4874 RepID=A0ABM8W2N1_GIGMA|nr:493_t:CDS:2 [Gigaspora margarita]
MSSHSRKPFHYFSKFVHIKKDNEVNQMPELDKEDDISQALFSTQSICILNETQAKNIKINTIITDSASSYNAAQEKFIKSVRVDDQQVKSNRVTVPVGDEEIDNIILELLELDMNDNDDFERLDKENISKDDISDNEIDKNLNELLNIQIHLADNDDTK